MLYNNLKPIFNLNWAFPSAFSISHAPLYASWSTSHSVWLIDFKLSLHSYRENCNDKLTNRINILFLIKYIKFCIPKILFEGKFFVWMPNTRTDTLSSAYIRSKYDIIKFHRKFVVIWYVMMLSWIEIRKLIFRKIILNSNDTI